MGGEEEKYRKELQELKKEHAELDKMILAKSSSEGFDQLRLQRLKKRKLWVRDRMLLIEKFLYPDIIA